MHMSEQTKRTLLSSLVSAVICGLIGFAQFDLVYFIPGPVFGFLFSIVNLTKPFRIAIFVAASSIIYIIAWNLFFIIVDDQLSMPNRDFAGLLAGLFGALALALLTKVISGSSIKTQDEVRTVILGAIAGILFIELMVIGFQVPYFAWPVAFAVWQVSVSWSLTISVQNQLLSQAAQLANPMN